MAPFPLIKLGSIFAKQLSKPIANYVKVKATQSQHFREYACVRPAQFYHWLDVRIRTLALGLDSSKVSPLKEAAAVQLAADVLGESVVIAVAVLMLYLEYSRRTQLESKKNEIQASQIETLENYTVSLMRRVARLEQEAFNK
ncbi:hypothetical protein GJ496_000408 [Pomphorhynchus laevis]|nr:hypothetical protein GJ496_000408 [Pomphorhynchus laevis]